jgi:hypothetical protein
MSKVTVPGRVTNRARGPGRLSLRANGDRMRNTRKLNHQMPYLLSGDNSSASTNISIRSELCSPGKDHRFGKGRDAERLQHVRCTSTVRTAMHRLTAIYLFVRPAKSSSRTTQIAVRQCSNSPSLSDNLSTPNRSGLFLHIPCDMLATVLPKPLADWQVSPVNWRVRPWLRV